MKKNKILYLSYDGLLEPLGQSQILSYQYIKLQTNTMLQLYLLKIRKDLNNINKLNLLKNNLEEKKK